MIVNLLNNNHILIQIVLKYPVNMAISVFTRRPFHFLAVK